MPKSILNLTADKLAPRLLGQFLCRRFPNGTVKKYVITEVEAYVGEQDKACHAHKGKTKRTAIMYGPPGHWYVYLIYGMYSMLNLVCAPTGVPHAVLIRSVKGITGPGRLTRALKIDTSFNAKLASPDHGLWVEFSNPNIPKNQIAITPRIGVDYAQEDKDAPLRFVLNL
ncbi:MAG: DNA-3-methyladenine glycosylase [bacterium]|nr:DNA-3-methyladenine glycosylase [bacterium]